MNELPPLDPSVDYSRSTARARWHESVGLPPRGSHRDVDVPFDNAPPGYCRWCGRDLGVRLKNGAPDPRRRWHADCARHYRTISSSAGLRAAVWARDGGICVDCPPGVAPWPQHSVTVFACGHETAGVTRSCWTCAVHRRPGCRPVEVRGWEADHVAELVDGGSPDLDNVVTRCIAHHRMKTQAARTARRTHLELAVPDRQLPLPIGDPCASC